VTLLKDRRRAYKVLPGRLVERDNLGEVIVDGKIILKWYLRKRLGGRGVDSSGSI
jgi:hypothetical protein